MAINRMALFGAATVSAVSAFAGEEKPNIVFILCDDLGIGDIGVYGQEKLKTPNIDSLARTGMLFTNHYSGSAVCAPSRCSLMTGRHMGHAFVRGNARHALPADTVTLAKVLKSAGYATGMFGKWGLGGAENSGSSKNQGFDEFFGYYNQGHAHTYYPTYLWHNDDKIELDGETYSHDLIWNKGMAFIKKEAKAGKPFFAYMAVTIPHAAMSGPPDLVEKWRKVYKEFDKKTGRYGGEPNAKDKIVVNPIAGFAAMMEDLDNQVGGLIAELKRLGVYKNTIIVFTSDNGAHHEGGHDPKFWNSHGAFRGYKRDLYEGGVHVPLLVSWTAAIKPGSKSNEISAFWDWLPTFAEIAGAEIPPGTKIDGVSILPTLTGKPQNQEHHKYLYWEFTEGGPKKAVRAGKWKAVWFYQTDGKTLRDVELFDLSKDIGEKHNVAKSHPEKLQELANYRDESHVDSKFFKFQGRVKKPKKKKR